RRCVRSGSKCTYSKRQRRLLQTHKQPHLRQPDRDGAHGGEVPLHSTPPGALAKSGRLPLTRFGRSASPATGLVGMQENTFLGDFFGCVGFLPLTTQSHIRETMVNIMVSPAIQQSFVGGDFGAEGPFDSIAGGAEWSKASGGHQLPMNPSTCTFWCAIALGALAKGTPLESVAKYCQLAHEALAKSCLGPTDAEVAKAWAIMGYLYGFMGDSEKYQHYLALSETYLRSSMEESSTDSLPVGFAEVVKFTEFGDSSCGQRQMKSCNAEERTSPQLSAAATEGEIYRYVAQSFKAFEQASHAVANDQSSKPGGRLSQGDRDDRSGSVRPSDNSLLCREISSSLGTVLGKGRCIDFEPLEEAVDRRPTIRGGIGSLLINLTLVFIKGAKGDLNSALERVGRCVAVFERYPGLCSGTMGYHNAHIVLVCLASVSDPRARAMYDSLRGAYNSFRPAGSLPVPPLEEWDGVDVFCDDCYCRAIEHLVASEHITAFSAPSVDTIDVGNRTIGTDSDHAGETLPGHVQSQPARPSACNIPQMVIDTVSDWRIESGAERRRGSSVGSTSPITRPVCSNSPCYQLEDGLHSSRFETSFSSVAMAPEPFSAMKELGEDGGWMDDREDDGVGAEDWLDVTHAMLGAL
ncbi:unnamed protein product, partial [Ectocarpus sp. 13 AM-2016]